MSRMRHRWDYTGWAIVLIAAALGLGWAGTMLLVAGPRTPPISEAQGQLLSAIGGGLVAILAAYMGMNASGRRPPRAPRDDEDDDVDSDS
jgi:hypothetical protein